MGDIFTSGVRASQKESNWRTRPPLAREVQKGEHEAAPVQMVFSGYSIPNLSRAVTRLSKALIAPLAQVIEEANRKAALQLGFRN